MTKTFRLPSLPANFNKLVKKCRNIRVSAADREKQRRSFAFGNANIESPDVTKEVVAATAELIDVLNKLTISEIMMGIMLYVGSARFTEQQLYRFFKTIDFDNRFKIHYRSGGRLFSSLIHTAIMFMKMGGALEDWGDHYEVRDSMRVSVWRELTTRNVLPLYVEFFKKLSNQFIVSLNK